MHHELVPLLDRQDGVVARFQLLEAGLTDSDIARLLRRRELARIHEGVYVAHTGQLTDSERGWAAVLFSWPAALCHRTVVGPDPGLRLAADEPVHVLVDTRRRVTAPPGVRVHRSRHFEQVAQLHLAPPRVRLEHAVLQVASDARDERAAVAVLAQACQSRRTTPERLLAALEQRPRQRRRRLLLSILRDVESGAHSVLEQMYLRGVERAHGLPRAARQQRTAVGRVIAYRDVEYVEQRLVVELDGRLGHTDVVDRWADLERDLRAAADSRMTLRLSYGQVLRPCRVAAAIATVLVARGWEGEPVPCGRGCPVAGVHGGSRAPAAADPPRIA